MSATSTGHGPGIFGWVELGTSDTAGAKRFYGGLFGWDMKEEAIPGGGSYTLLRLSGREIGGMYPLWDEQKKQGVPPHWLSYVSCTSADETAAKAKRLGGQVLKEPFDVMDLGRMAVIQDPTGAVFAIWQAKKTEGSGHMDNRPGSACWNELVTKNVDQAGKFYADLFGWKPQAKQFGPMTYTVFHIGERQVGGMMQMPPQMGAAPSHWMVYFAVENCDASAEKARGLGGQVMVPPTDIPNVGRFAALRDPQGAAFSVIKLAPM